LACIAYLPLPKLQNSIYRDLALPTLHFDLEPLFAKEYCASLGMSRQVPLRVVGDIGGGGALARIEKGRKVMGDRKGEWSQLAELPVRFLVLIPRLYQADNFFLTDRNPSSIRQSVSFNLRLSGVEGTIHGIKSADDDELWACYLER